MKNLFATAFATALLLSSGHLFAQNAGDLILSTSSNTEVQKVRKSLNDASYTYSASTNRKRTTTPAIGELSKVSGITVPILPPEPIFPVHPGPNFFTEINHRDVIITVNTITRNGIDIFPDFILELNSSLTKQAAKTDQNR